jgi:two-component system, NtrC family, sensor kinase
MIDPDRKIESGESTQSGIAAHAPNEFLRRAELAEAQLAGVADLADVGVLLFDRNGALQLMNDRFVILLRAERTTLAGARNWAELAAKIAKRVREPDVFLERWRDCMQRDEGASWDELELAKPNGGTIERFSRPIFSPNGESLGRVEIYRDVSTRRLLEGKLLQTNKLAGLGQLTSGTVHELNNPLTGIMGYAQLLLRRGLAPQATAEARQIYQEAERASRIIRNLLHFARDTRGERSPVNLNDIAEHTAALRSHQLKLENIRMDLDFDPRLPFVIADAGQLQQVALNLVINAEQAIGRDSSGGVIRLRTELLKHDRVILEVSDTGPGIEPDILPNIFDPFFTTKPPGMGTGLGLSVAFGIIHDHGGVLSARSELGRGASFTIELAAVAALRPGSSPASAKLMHRIPRSSDSRPERVLVIEDEPTVVRLIADVLEEDGHVVDTALDSRDGLARALEFSYDLLICDLKMPFPDGRAIYEELLRRQSPVTRRMIFITGDTLAVRTMDFLEFAGLPYLAKPFRVEDLKNSVAELLARTRRDTGANPSAVERRRGTRENQ